MTDGVCTSECTATDDYDVFLSHHGPDVKSGFLAHLDEALRSAGFNPFLDKKSLVKGEPAFISIDDALEVAKIHVAVVSKGYAASKWCLSELVTMIRSGKPVIPVFYEVEPADLRRVENGPFAEAFEKHKSRERAEQVEEWADALRKLADIYGFCFRLTDYKGDEAELKREVVDAVMSLTCTNEALQVERHIVGLEEPLNTCVHELQMMSGSIGFLGLVGMGGIGKTFLAKEIYNHFVGRKKFQFMSFLEIDRSSSSKMEVGSSLLSRLQKQLLWDLLGVPDNTKHSYKYWFHRLSSRGPVMIVLDDIHDKRQFDKLIPDTTLLALGSCIIVTSRDRHLLKVIAGASNFYLHEIRILGCDDSEKLFNWHAFGDEEAPKKFKALAHAVSKACGGLPLALKVVGSSMFNKTSDEDRESIWPEAVDALRGDPDVMGALKWSYNSLPVQEKLMFLDIACVFCGWEKQKVIEIWKSCKNCSSCCGSGTPHTSLRHLIDKSLVVLEWSLEVLAMHGLLRDMGKDIGRANGSHLWEGSSATAILDKNQGTNKVRALNLANTRKRKFEGEDFAKMSNLHFLVFDGCDVSSNLGSISKELRWLQWIYLPSIHLPAELNLFNLISLDLSYSSKLANLWAESDPSLEACPNLLRLELRACTSIRTLPDSIRHLSRLQVLDLNGCSNLQKLPNSIGQLTALQELVLARCPSLVALPDTIAALSGLYCLDLYMCSSMSRLLKSVGLMTGLNILSIDLATEGQAVGIGQFNALKGLSGLRECTDEIITLFDSSGALRNLDQLTQLSIWECTSITKFPETIALLTNLEFLRLEVCEYLQELPYSLGQLKVLSTLILIKCNSLQTLPDSLGELISLEYLEIEECKSITTLPMSIGHLSSLLILRIQGCVKLQSLPESIRQLNALEYLSVSDCGSLKGLGASRMLQGLRIWGCTSITELPGSYLIVVDIHGSSLSWPAYWDEKQKLQIYKELRLLEASDCGSLRVLQDIAWSERLILLRVHKLPCCIMTL